MAPSPKFTTVFLLILLTLSVQSHARQFFSKIPSTNNIPKETTIPDTEQPESTFLPENQKQDNLPNNNQDQQQEPNFLPQAQTGYGLYGHESGLNTPETAIERVTYAPYVTPITSGSFVDDNNNAFEEEQSQNLGANARFAETNNDGYRRTITKGNSYNSGNGGGYKTAVTNDDSYNNGDGYRRTITKGNNYNSGNGYKNDDSYNNGDGYRRTISNDGGNYYNGKTVGNDGGNYYNNNGYRKTVTNDGGNYYNGNSYRNNVERQGMSDTRFMENGKYFYDVENEQNYSQNRNQFQNNRVNMRNENTFSTNGAGYYGNGNVNSYNQVNGQKYENKEDVEEFEP